MAITYDPAKRAWTLRERGLDFEDAAALFAGWTIDIPDLRRAYGEPRINTVGYRRIISMRRANDREKARYQKRSEES